MSALRIIGDLSKLPSPRRGLDKRILAKCAPRKRCPRCKREWPIEKFFYSSIVHHSRGLPTATPTRTCASCRGGNKSKTKVRKTVAD